ncbi:hypothetical protein ONZ45_g7187 [Pleurotus djamor]|nr:hypothetical protein ONZ45_g7187 [Pleurotus djamor]
MSGSSMLGEPPFFLYCNHCRWDSAEVGITFEKPTGLAAQLQKVEDSAPESLEFERLKEHFEPFIRAASVSASTSSYPHSTNHHPHAHPSSSIAAASAALSRDIPGVARYNAHGRSAGRSGKDKTANKDEFPVYKSRMDVMAASNSFGGGGERDVELMQHMESPYEIASLEQRWGASWTSSLKIDDLKPLRVPLHAKRTKRCSTCTHILIKPEQKAQSVRYKIKLMAANYLPAISIALPHVLNARPPTQEAKRTLGRSAAPPQPEDDRESQGGMYAGKTYPFHLAFTNPLYDPIQIKLSVQRVHVTTSTAPTTAGTSAKEGTPAPEKARRPPFAISLPTSFFSVAAFAEAWEYDDDEDMFDDESLGLGGTGYGSLGRAGREKEVKSKTKNVGVLEKRANVTVVGGEVVIGKEARGNVKFNMLVTYTYRSDDGGPTDDVLDSPSKTKHSSSLQPEVKTFAFYTVVDLGPIIPRDETTRTTDVEAMFATWLPLLILISMILGVVIGVYAERGVHEAFGGAQWNGVSIPVMVGLLLMMWPVLTKVKYECLFSVLSTRTIWMHIALSFLLNWIVAPFIMLGLQESTIPRTLLTVRVANHTPSPFQFQQHIAHCTAHQNPSKHPSHTVHPTQPIQKVE